MKNFRLSALILCLVACSHVQAAVPAPPSSLPLLTSVSLVYKGAFRALPGRLGATDAESFEYGGTALTFNPAHQSLYVVGNNGGQLVAEIAIPVLKTGAVSTLNAASLLQPFVDITNGARTATPNPFNPLGGNGIVIGGLASAGTTLYGTGYSWYDANATQAASHYRYGLSDHSFLGPIKLTEVGVVPSKVGYVSGYLGTIPVAWQAALGGSYLTGNCCISIIGRTSYGPAAFATDLDLTHPTTYPLVYYPDTAPLGPYNGSSIYFNGSTTISGVVFPEGTRSVLFFGAHGLGPFCYGQGTNDASLAGQTVPGFTDVYCYDPESNDKGTHGYPYAYYIEADDANDLAAVHAGTKLPSDVKPYAVWALNLPKNGAPDTHLGGAAYDPATGTIYVSQLHADRSVGPVFHAFAVDLGAQAPVSITSNPATLTVTTPATIVAQPVNQTVVVGATVTFTVTAAGSPAPTFQWQGSADGTTWVDLTEVAPYSGTKTNTLTITSAPASLSGHQYRVVVTQ